MSRVEVIGDPIQYLSPWQRWARSQAIAHLRSLGSDLRLGERERIAAAELAHFMTLETGGELEAARQANLKLVGALNMVRETLNGGTVDDLLYIINTALSAHRAAGGADAA